MSLQEAIVRALERAEDLSACPECRRQHQQLAEWLIELKRLKDFHN